MPQRFISILSMLLMSQVMHAQNWIDTIYSIQLATNIDYGSSIDFAGTNRTHKLNLCIPVNDVPPACGRPLLLAIHGGAFLAGNKDADQIPGWVANFAKRGYTTASINYRLGMFQTNQFINCNVTALGFPWNCLNMQDTSEWSRASYRAMQDAKGALRFLLQNSSTYKIDPRNVFVVGESAGAITALNVAYLDMESEKPSQAESLGNALPPNSLYENTCIQTPGFANSISAMQLTRPDLGSIVGEMNPTSMSYKIKGVGSFYGGMLTNLFNQHVYPNPPALYMYHQPNDLVVPYDFGRVEEGLSYCFTFPPANCQYIINTPYIFGSKGIKKMIDTMTNLAAKPVYYFDSTNNITDCFGQILNPSLSGHSVDNSWLRAMNMATFFASKIDTSGPCGILSNSYIEANPLLSLYPNPVTNYVKLTSKGKILFVKVLSMNGQVLWSKNVYKQQPIIEIPKLNNGIYIFQANVDGVNVFNRISILY